MIHPKQFSLHNFCQFTNQSFSYRPGITVVTAPNGSGKTNMFEVGQFFSWSGLVPGAKSKDDLVKDDESKGGTDLFFHDDRGYEYHLSRSIPGSKTLLKWKEGDEDKTITKNQEVSEFMEKKMGVPLKMFSNISFIRQGTFMNVVSDRQSRMEHFNRITDTLKYQDIRKMLVSAKSDLPDFPDQRPEMDNMKAQRDQLKEEESQFKETYEQLQEQRDQLKDSESEANRILSCYTDKGLDEQIQQKEQEIAQLKEQFPECPEVPEQPDVTQEQLNEAQKKITRYQQEVQKLSETENSLNNLQEPQLEDDLDLNKMDVLEMKKGLLSAAQVSVKEGQCVLCSSELPEDFTEEKFREEADNASQLLDRIHEYQKKLHQYQEKKSELEKSRSDLEQTVQGLKDDLPDENWVEEQKQKLEAYNQALSEYNRSLREYHNHQTRVQQKEGEYNQLLERRNNSVTEDQKKWAENIRDKIQDLDSRLSGAWNEYQSKSADIRSLDSQLSRLEKEQSKKDDMDRKKSMLERSSEHLKPNNLPMRIMQPFLQSFNPALQKYLSEFNVDYSCRLNPEFIYEFNRGYGWKQAEKRMSGGQLVNLALSSYLATMEIMSPAVPLLVLDEPTDSLDDIRKQGLIQAFSQLNASYNNLYIIIITHDEDVKEAADYTVELAIED